MSAPQDERGYTLVEVLVAVSIFSLLGVGFVSVMMSGARGSDVTRRNVRVSEEARLGLNRIVRDVREAGWIELPGNSPSTAYTSFTIRTDYNGNGTYANPAGPAGAESNFEIVTYAYDPAAGSITVTAEGFPTETLVRGVTPVSGRPVFSFTSNRLEYDLTPFDGVVTLAELDAAACPAGGNNLAMDTTCNGVLVAKELANITNVTIALTITSEGTASQYFAEAEMRNRR